MFSEEGGVEIEPDELARRAVATEGIEGVTLLGGEPFEQAAECARFARGARDAGLGVMVFSGWTRAELDARAARDAGVAALLAACDLLVDGRFERDAPERARRWIGSRNQVMHFLTRRYAPGDPRFFAPNTAELRLEDGALVMNGWPALVPALRGPRAR
jgi:anaerobic ribonucleoside-triphosphate reductase activating protein